MHMGKRRIEDESEDITVAEGGHPIEKQQEGEPIEDASPRITAPSQVYHQLQVVLRISDLNRGNYQVRETNPNDPMVQRFVQSFLQKEYGAGQQVITCAFVDMSPDVSERLYRFITTTEAYVHEETKLAGPNLSDFLTANTDLSLAVRPFLLRYIDGMHRGVALSRDDVVAVEPYPRVTLFIRKDYQPITELECVLLGSRFNAEASLMIPMVKYDRFHSLFSVLACMREIVTKGGEIAGMKQYGVVQRTGHKRGMKRRKLETFLQTLVRGEATDHVTFAKYCMRNGWSLGVEERQLRSYAAVVLPIFKYAQSKDKLLDLALSLNLPIVKLGTPAIWDTENVLEQEVLLQCLQGILKTEQTSFPNDRTTRANRRARRKSQENRDARAILKTERGLGIACTAVKDIWRQLTTFLKTRGLDDEGIYELQIPVELNSNVKQSLDVFVVQQFASTPLSTIVKYAEDSESRDNFVQTLQQYISSSAKLPQVKENRTEPEKDDAESKRVEEDEKLRAEQKELRDALLRETREIFDRENRKRLAREKEEREAREKEEREERERKEREAREKEEREARERQEREAREKEEREAREKKEREERERKEREAREKKEREEREKEEREARERQEREARELQEREVRERQEREARERQEREVRERQEREARERQEREAREKQEREARERQEREAREKEEREAREREEREARKREEREAREKEEREAREKQEQEARELEQHRKEQQEREEREKKLREASLQNNAALLSHIQSQDKADGAEEDPKDEGQKKGNDSEIKNSTLAITPRHSAATNSRAIVKMPVDSIEVNEEVDTKGFSITARSPTLREGGDYIYVSYHHPETRSGGYTDVTEAIHSITVDDVIVVKEGTMTELGTNLERTITLFQDEDDGIGLARKDFKLLGQLRDDSIEWKYARDMESTVEDKKRYEECNYQLLLRAIGLRPPHRSFLAFAWDELHSIRRALAGSVSHVYRVEFNHSYDHSELLRMMDLLKIQMTARFHMLRTKLDYAGYTILPGIFDMAHEDERVLNPIWNHPETGESSWSHYKSVLSLIHNLFDHFQRLIPSEDQVRNAALTPEQIRTWDCIRNTHRSAKPGMTTSCRLTTCREAVTRDLEWPYKGGETEKLVCGKAIMETAIMQIASWLRLEFESYDQYEDIHDRKQDMIELECLDTGGRFISLVGKDAKRQVGHYDEFFPNTAEVNKKNGSLLKPSYFSLVTGPEGSPLWVANGSPYFVSLSAEEQRRLAHTIPLKMIRIPPWSIFIARADLVHAGAGGKDANGRQCLRFHMYIHRINLCLGDAINSYMAHWYKVDRNSNDIGPEENISRF